MCSRPAHPCTLLVCCCASLGLTTPSPERLKATHDPSSHASPLFLTQNASSHIIFAQFHDYLADDSGDGLLYLEKKFNVCEPMTGGAKDYSMLESALTSQWSDSAQYNHQVRGVAVLFVYNQWDDDKLLRMVAHE